MKSFSSQQSMSKPCTIDSNLPSGFSFQHFQKMRSRAARVHKWAVSDSLISFPSFWLWKQKSWIISHSFFTSLDLGTLRLDKWLTDDVNATVNRLFLSQKVFDQSARGGISYSVLTSLILQISTVFICKSIEHSECQPRVLWSKFKLPISLEIVANLVISSNFLGLNANSFKIDSSAVESFRDSSVLLQCLHQFHLLCFGFRRQPCQNWGICFLMKTMDLIWFR